MKYNESTRNRPEGDRIINNSWVKIDINQYTAELQSEEWRKNDRKSITVFKNDQLTVVLMLLSENAQFFPHDAEGTMSVQIMEGMLDLDIEGNEISLESGNIAAINKGVRYSGIARQTTLALLTVMHID
jgi:quercetin dioxygenase-like cupin family protein